MYTLIKKVDKDKPMAEDTPKIRVDPDIYHQARVAAANERRTLKDFTEEAIRLLLSTKPTTITITSTPK
jgi:predicted HicB family RNase H-like nuclease